MNRIATRYCQDFGMADAVDDWDERLYMPPWLVSEEEHERMEALIDVRVQELHDCKAIVDPQWLATTFTKPLWPFWVTPHHDNLEDMSTDKCYAVICLNASNHYPNWAWKEDGEFWYTPGAADDQEAWARHLTPKLFWNIVETILDKYETDNEVDVALDALVAHERQDNDDFEAGALHLQNLFDAIGDTNIAIETRRAGRPPECWHHFDAILNVTDMEYPDIHKKCWDREAPVMFYLQLPVKESKQDRSELERWMAVGMAFCLMHAQQQWRILIHCAQGKDWLVAVAMAVIVLFCDLTFPLWWKDEMSQLMISDLESMLASDDETQTETLHHKSIYQTLGLLQRLVNGLQGREGRDCLLQWIRHELNLPEDNEPLATKETLRIALY